jgi:hypothetical protein
MNHNGHPLLWLALATFGLVMAWGVYNLLATKRQQKHGHDIEGIGGKNDPFA